MNPISSGGNLPMQKTAVLSFAAALLLVAGCQVDPTKFRCTSSAECPTGYHCDLGTATAAGTLKCANGAAPQKTLAADASKFLLLRGPSPDGTVRTLADYAGQGVVLNLWATWCVPCVAEMPALDALARQVAGDRVAVLTLSSDRGGAPPVERFYREKGIQTLCVIT